MPEVCLEVNFWEPLIDGSAGMLLLKVKVAARGILEDIEVTPSERS